MGRSCFNGLRKHHKTGHPALLNGEGVMTIERRKLQRTAVMMTVDLMLASEKRRDVRWAGQC